MKFFKKFIGGLLGLSSAFLLSSIVMSLAWFITENNIDMGNLEGSVLTSYFDVLEGQSTTDPNYGKTKENPFVIDRPKHWENLVKLHYDLPGFDTSGFYFQVGKDLDGSGEPKVYSYNDEGRIILGEYSTTLNLAALSALPPLGDVAKPFLNHIDGKGICISNFTVKGETDEMDIGIFGYVGYRRASDEVDEETGYLVDYCVKNLYFSDFTIDTGGARWVENTSEQDDQESNKYHKPHKGNFAHAGYLAGHVLDSSCFQDVYVNQCDMEGTEHNSKLVCNYGYYGMADMDALGGEAGKGNNYKFTLNASAFYQYINGIYDARKDSPLLLRNTKETDENPSATEVLKENYTKEGDTYYDENHKEVPSYEAIKYSVADPNDGSKFRNGLYLDTALTTTTYAMNGPTPTDPDYEGRTYSASTFGYRDYPYDYIEGYYDLRYKDGSTVKQMPISHAEETVDGQTETVYTPKIRKDEGSIEAIYDATKKSDGTANGDYLFFHEQNQRWEYLNLEARLSSKADTSTGSITLHFPTTSYSKSSYLVNPNLTLKPSSSSFYVWVDGQKKTYSFKSSTSSLSTDYFAASVTTGVAASIPEFTMTIPDNLVGKNHTVSACITLVFTVKGLLTTNNYRVQFYYGNYDSGNNKLTNEGSITVTNMAPAEYTFTGKGSHDCSNSSSNDISVSGTTYDTNNCAGVPIMINDSESYPVVGREQVVTVDQGTGAVSYSPKAGATYNYEMTEKNMSFDYRDTQVFGHEVKYKIIPDSTPDDEFLGDSQQLIDSGYSSDNIDIVGGGITFYSRSILGTQINIISMPSQNTTDYCIKDPAAYIGQKFYSTTHTPCSVVLYLKNMSNARDTRDDSMGSISFTYAEVTIIGYTIEQVAPSFIKGNGNALGLESAGFGTKTANREAGGLGSITSTINVPDLKESDVMKACYCALDKQGNVLGKFDTSGNPSTGFTGADEAKLADIDTYVIVLGCTSNDDSSCWITNIDFSYTAESGFGGTFGSIEYRSPSEKVKTTIFNFYFEFAAGDKKYRVTMAYDSASSTYTMYFYSTTALSGEQAVRYYIYQISDSDDPAYGATYSGVINGGSAVTSKGTTNIAASSESTWTSARPAKG